ncbi:hypothetical protein conserved [Leishmania donovani]|uniref:Uncharacterized protein n=3 Tax=Leishmania donovani species complex TaxID=38574 RepID=A4HY49_LEIIN|nr:conserved hypothetical protein [Leishmania infantum JPCM5]XP_003860205.1 hypothetical protein, conserved [Leishmania donovani]CAC9482405.1 hypothetical_protein_-_conserved [Leishmania infantum]AYU78124.1 hypothetical protein LdCL_190007600 [Leishmania donovani]TPP41853.1 hypothetical protein CGC20_9190 [Leishmania donovani]TPP51041.1 hypothetical protein CGC21_19460 [Leishmania donovani]CAJ1988141.1 hypothetical protein conserved [Leishmania donovani]|eukprot:XP_001464990.1 conserved hypothetical protein [Leishmania infantum JPCM5]
METNRPPSTAKWVSRRTLDSQANNRENNAGLTHPRGSNSDKNPNSANHHHGAEKRRYGHAPDAVIAAIGRGSGSGNAGGAAAADNSPSAPFHTNGGCGNNRFGISGSGHGGGWGSNAPNSHATNNELNHQGNTFATNTVNAHGPHSNGNNNANGGSRRGYGAGGGYGEATEPTIPPPPRSVQMGQGALAAQAAAATSRDFIPQPRHAKANSSASSHSLKSMEASPPPPGAVPSVPPATHSPSSTPALRWGFNATPTPRSANGGAATPNAPPLAYTAASHFDALAGLLAPKSATPSPLASAADGGGPEATVAAQAPPPFTAAPLAFTTTVPSVNASLASTAPGAGAPAPLRSFAATSAVNVEPSPLDSFHIGENLSFGASAFGGSLHSQPSEIETLLGQVERSAGTLPAGAAGERVIGGSLRERRSVTDWGIEEAIRTVLPGMDEDESSDNMQGPNFSGGIAAITGNWHTSGDVEAQPVASGGVSGLLADFPTSFAASFSEPASTLLQSPFAADAASNTMDNLSRAFSTAARVDSCSFTTSPATTTATPLQRPPTSPGVRLPNRVTPVESMSMPPSMRDLAHPGGNPYTAPTATQPPPPRSAKSEVSARVEDLPGAGQGGSSEFFNLYTLPPPATTSPWLSSGIGESAAPMAPVNRTSDSMTAKLPGHRSPRTTAARPERLQAIPLKEGSMNSNGGLTTTTGSTTSPALAAARQSSTSSHGGSAPNTPSLRKELSTPLSGSRSQPYTPGGSRPQRPSLSAPLVNRHTITHIFRETPQSLRRRERMEHNHYHSDQALCKDFHWPPHDEADAEHMLRERNATKLLRHLTIISFSRQHVSGVQELFDTWAKNGIPAPDMGFGAYYFYVKEKSEKLLCMKHNGRGASPGHGYGRCDFESRRPYSTCRYEHVCLFCRSKEHGWFEEGKCQGYQQLLTEMEELGVTEEDVVTLLNAMERPAKPTRSR